MFGGKALGWMAGTLIWMPGTLRARAGQTYPHKECQWEEDEKEEEEGNEQEDIMGFFRIFNDIDNANDNDSSRSNNKTKRNAQPPAMQEPDFDAFSYP